MILDADTCYRAVRTRDPRFDGRFFTAVKTTGIYCRPLCPARTPRRENITFYPSAAAAQAAGYRPCLRCRPEVSPGSPASQGTYATVARAVRLIEDGALDGGDVPALARRLGVGDRHLRRLFVDHLGAGPLAVAQTRRVHLARTLLEQTHLTMTEVALAAGFSSVRRFNSAMRGTYACPPTELRRQRVDRNGRPSRVRLGYRPPFDWKGLIGFLGPRAIPGVERVTPTRYERVVRFAGTTGLVVVEPLADRAELAVELSPELSPWLSSILERLRRLFDLRADADEIDRHLGADPELRPFVRRRRGRRVPGAFDGFELAVRAILGQQVSVAGATTLSGRLVRACGRRSTDHGEALGFAFPIPEELLLADLGGVGLTGARLRTLRLLAEAVLEGTIDLEASPSLEEAVAQLASIPGIGDWTAHYVAMRALGEPDAFPAGDLALRRALGKELSARDLRTRAEAWRPWRAYAAMSLWQGMKS